MTEFRNFFYKAVFSLTFFYLSLYASQTCLFVPPKDWEIANPDMLAPRVHVCFLGKSSKGLAPSVNLATEPAPISLDAYIEEVRKIHASDPNSRWRDLGQFKTHFGNGRLTELETPTPLGTARLVQLILVKDQVAYILTVGSLKEEFSKYYKTFDQILRSLQFSSNLVASYPSKPAQIRLQQMIAQLETDFMAHLYRIIDASSIKLPLSWKKPTQEAILSPLLKLIEQNRFTSLGKPFEKRIYSSPLQSSNLQRLILHSTIQQKAKDQVFFSSQFQTNVWEPFEKKIINDFTEMGPYWQILLLKEIHAKLLTARSK